MKNGQKIQTDMSPRNTDGRQKRCSPPPIIKKMQTKSTIRYYLILSEWLTYSTRNNRCWKDVNKEELSCSVGGNEPSSATLENSMEVPQDVENRATLGSSNHTTGYLPNEYENGNSKGCMHPYVSCNIIYKITI